MTTYIKQRFEPVNYAPKEIIRNFDTKDQAVFTKEIKDLLLAVDDKYWDNITKEFERQCIDAFILDIIYDVVDQEATRIVNEQNKNPEFDILILKALASLAEASGNTYYRLNETTTFHDLKIITVADCLYEAYNYTEIFQKGLENSLYTYIHKNKEKFEHIPDKDITEWVKDIIRDSSFDTSLPDEIKNFLKPYNKKNYTVIFKNAYFPTDFEATNAEEAVTEAIKCACELAKRINIRLKLQGGYKVYETKDYKKNQENAKPVYMDDKEICIE